MTPTLKSETPVLYAAPLSGFAYKVALTLRLLGLPCDLRVVDLSVRRDERPGSFRDVARFDEVPTLLIDGHALCQSNAICEYLARRQSALHEGDESQRLVVREWLFWEAERIGLDLAHCCAGRDFGRHPPEVLAWYDMRAAKDIERIAKALATHRFLVGDTVTIADIACYAWLPYAQAHGLFAELPEPVASWQARIEALPGFATPSQIFSGEAA
ncbi:glutathione S-transferase family protein [Xanthomonadaceae bacterium JHOS43]|nr:glutathione S-transferase family protein [Xanthomonadaceae bacterium JHOS43]